MIKGIRGAGAGAALLLATSPLAAGEAPTHRPDCAVIQSFLDSAVQSGRTVGASALVWQDGAERCFAAAGDADREARRPITRDTLFQIYSMTKPVTGVALMQLWEQGKFGLDDPLEWHLPEYAALKVAAGTNPDGTPILREPRRKVTVRDVLRHTAGFTYGGGDNPQNAADRVWAQLEPLSSDKTLAEFSQAMAQVPLRFEPGTRWEYSAGVDVQARLVEVLSGQPFADYVAQHIFQPLGMTDSGWKRSAADRARLARIYEGENGALVPWDDDRLLNASFMGKPMTMGGAGIVATLDDYMKFARMLLGEGTLGDVRILKPSTVRLMASDQLDPRIAPAERSWLVSKGNGGFGFNLFVRTGQPLTPGENRGSVGEFYWDGMPSMLFWVDPAQDMVVILGTQKVPFDNDLHRDFRVAVYGADYTGPAGD
jgi:CubicO group peptidase (beta-lactamase class C family)